MNFEGIQNGFEISIRFLLAHHNMSKCARSLWAITRGSRGRCVKQTGNWMKRCIQSVHMSALRCLPYFCQRCQSQNKHIIDPRSTKTCYWRFHAVHNRVIIAIAAIRVGVRSQALIIQTRTCRWNFRQKWKKYDQRESIWTCSTTITSRSGSPRTNSIAMYLHDWPPPSIENLNIRTSAGTILASRQCSSKYPTISLHTITACWQGAQSRRSVLPSHPTVSHVWECVCVCLHENE